MHAKEIVGHVVQREQLLLDQQRNNVSHAYLFTGAAHLGKTAIAHWFARKILCADIPDDQRKDALHRMDHLVHPDLLVLDQLWMDGKNDDWNVLSKSSNVPQQHRAKAKMKSDVISIDDVRAIQERLQETGELPHRVCIIRGVERMQSAAANAFLKMLEEPPPGRVFILTTESPSLILPTIISRSRVMRFERVAVKELQQLLSNLPEEDASFILHVAQGAPGIAHALMNDPDKLHEERMHHTQAASFWSAPHLLDRMKQLEPLIQKGPDADRFLFHLALALRETPDYQHSHVQALQQFSADLQTNASRPLIVQRFAMGVE